MRDPKRTQDHSKFKDSTLDAVAIVYAPGRPDDELRLFTDCLRHCFESLSLTFSQLFVNPSKPQWDAFARSSTGPVIVVGWGLSDKPNWRSWIRSRKMPYRTKNILAIDLVGKGNGDNRPLRFPRVDYKTVWNLRGKRWEMLKFLNGFYVCRPCPFGLKLVHGDGRVRIINTGNKSGDYVLRPGAPEDIEIVKLIFRLYGQDEYSRPEIVNLLNAERIPPPTNKLVWKKWIITRILSDPVYIGSNRYAACILPNVFPPIIDKLRFEEVVRKLNADGPAIIAPYSGRSTLPVFPISENHSPYISFEAIIQPLEFPEET